MRTMGHPADFFAQSVHLGRPQVRMDGRAKVTGSAVYASDRRPPNRAHAALVTSAICRDRIGRFDFAAAPAVLRFRVDVTGGDGPATGPINADLLEP